MPSSLPPVPAADAPASRPAMTATEALYRASLAEGDIAFYLPVFADFDEHGVTRPRWNPAAGLLNLSWLLYRRLWRASALYALATVATGAALWGFGAVLGALGPLLWLGFMAVAVAVPGFWGTAWLHNDVRRRMTAAVRRARTVQEACDTLRQQDRWRPVLVMGVALQAMLALLIGLDVSGPAASTPPERDAIAVGGPVAAGIEEAPAALAEPLPGPTPATAQALSENPPLQAAPPQTASAETLVTAAAADGAPRPRLRGHGVNVGMFSDPGNADRARQRLVDAGLPVIVDPVESSRGTLIRVRVGPFEDEAAARKAADTVRAVGLEARVFGP